jgi:hypothetical protein
MALGEGRGREDSMALEEGQERRRMALEERRGRRQYGFRRGTREETAWF